MEWIACVLLLSTSALRSGVPSAEEIEHTNDTKEDSISPKELQSTNARTGSDNV